ncbi:DUF5123 domain-containing protein [Prolixibacteraceae bacterium Z1-6]|uniref:DUF5123 domain-containing protein n=1 Tax=Draconibacterium aestuarii TaxID=2998507 RepID=A0A9X3F957_9BACT|nr:DUF5123 domain-containing protein [Prolixibacteraceae bacterium Z1-6]
MKKIFTLKMLMMACFIFIAGYSHAQYSFRSDSNIGQSLETDTETHVATFLVHFNTSRNSSNWSVADGIIGIKFEKCRTQKGMQALVYVADSANAPAVNNEDFKLRGWNRNDNAVHMQSIDSMIAIFDKWAEKYEGTADSAKVEDNVIWKPSACLFDIEGDPDNQGLGVHPGMYKRVEYGFHYKFEGYDVASDIEFEIDTYDEGNTGATASYDLVVAVGSETEIVNTISDFYVTGSGKKMVKLAEAVGLEYSAFAGKKVYFWLKTKGTGTEMAKDKFDPTIVIDNMVVKYNVPYWVEPATDNNAEDPFTGVVGEETLFAMPLKTKGRLSALKIIDNLYVNGKGDKFNKKLTFLDTLGVMANDGNGNYTVEVPYTLTPATLDMGTMEWSNQGIEIAASTEATDDDLMFFFKATPEAVTYYCNLEIDCGARIFYKAHIKGTGSNVIDLTDVEDGYILKDTLTGVPADAQIVLAPGKMYYIGGYAFDKSMEFTSSDPDAEMKPLVNCGATGLEGYGKNFDMVADSSVDYIIFRNLKFFGDFGDNYVMNVSKQSTIGDLLFESCEVKSLRGVVRIKDNPSVINNYTVYDCVMDSIQGYGLLTMDKSGGAVNNIMLQNSTFSRFQYFIRSKENSQSVSIINCTFFEVPDVGRQFMRYDQGDGHNLIVNGLTIQKCIFGHGWDMDNEDKYTFRGFDGSVSTPFSVSQTIVTSDFSYSGDSIPGLGSDKKDFSSAELWVDPMNGNFNMMREDVAGWGLGDPRWVYEDTTTYLLYAGAGAADAMEPSDSLLVDYLMKAGYDVKYVDDNDIAAAGYDYSKYEALIIGESSSSGNVVAFGKEDGYPIPLVSMEGFGVKTNKWGWLTDDANFQESRVAGLENMEMKVLDNTHYITEELAVDQVVSLSAAAASSDIYAWGIDLTVDVPGAIALGQNQNVEITYPMLWAIPRGTALGASGQTTDNRIVLFVANAKGLDEATNDFNMLVERSLEWVLGAGGTTSVSRIEVANDVLVYPNPAKNHAKVRFTLTESSEVSLSLFNMMGQKIDVSTRERFSVGINEIEINTQRLNEGMYIYVLEVGQNVAKGKLNISK